MEDLPDELKAEKEEIIKEFEKLSED